MKTFYSAVVFILENRREIKILVSGHLDMEDKFLFVLYFLFLLVVCDFPLFCENLTKKFWLWKE